MNYWLHSFILASENEGFGINTDILETNLINIIILVVLLVYLLGNFLKENLSSRQEQILSSIQESEKRLNEASERLAEADLQWAQIQIVIEESKSQTKRTLTSLNLELESKVNDYIVQRCEETKRILSFQKPRIFNEVKKEIFESAFKEANVKLQTKLKKIDPSLIIDSKINKLGGQI